MLHITLSRVNKLLRHAKPLLARNIHRVVRKTSMRSGWERWKRRNAQCWGEIAKFYIYIYISGSEMQILYLELYRVQAFKVIKFCGDEARSGRSTNEICPVIYERAANRCHGDESKAIVNSRLNLHTRSDIVPWHGDKKLRCGYLLLGTMKYIRGAEYCFTSAIDHRDCRTWPQFFPTNTRIIFVLLYSYSFLE